MVGTLRREKKAVAAALDGLAEQIRAIEHRGRGDEQRSIDPGWGGRSMLGSGVVHEWLGLAPPPPQSAGHGVWSPPLFVLSHLARRMLDADRGSGGWVLWIGQRIWPHPQIFINHESCDGALLRRSMFINARDTTLRVWAIDLALRSPAVTTVIADGSGLTVAQTRRLQLAAEHGNAWALLARPPWEHRKRSCAATRWLVQRLRSFSNTPRWRISLSRCKDAQHRRALDADQYWNLEWDHATGCVCPSADVVDRPHQAPRRRATG